MSTPTPTPTAADFSAHVAAGMSWPAIGRIYGMSEYWSRKQAIRFGVFDPLAGRKKSTSGNIKIGREEMLRVIALGQGVSFLAQHFRVTHDSIMAAAKRFGIAIPKAKGCDGPSDDDHRRALAEIRKNERKVWRESGSLYGVSSCAGNWA